MKKNKNLILLICINTLMFLIILIYKKITPFGDNSFLQIDFFHQYFPFSGELFDRVWHSKSLIYSFTSGIGLPLYRNFFNYLSSPFNILILLFKRTSMLSVYSIIICLKGIVSSVFMYLLLKKKFGDKFILIPICLMYSFCAYYIAYNWNIMWLDGITLLPLVILGLENLVDKNKSLLYIVSLSLVIFSNYYIGFMICIFVVLYFIMYLITSNKYSLVKIRNKVIRFILSSLGVGLICSFFLIPMYYSIKSISAVEPLKIPDNLYYGFKFRDFIFNHFNFISGTVTHSDISNAPNISCGILSLLLIVPFIFNKKIDLKIRIGYLVLLFIIGISFFIPALDYFWHICHVPNDLPYRFSFLYSFVLIIISAYSLVNIKYVNKLYVYLSFLLVLIAIIYLNVVGYSKIDNIYIVLNYVVWFIYFVCYRLYLRKFNKLSTVIFVVTSILGILLTININWDMDIKVSDYYHDYNDMKRVIKEIKDNDNSFYRIGNDNPYTCNDSAWYGYNGVISFSSMEYKNIANLLYKLGYHGNEINSYGYDEGNRINEILFNIKYSIYRGESGYNYYELPFSSGLMFLVNSDVYNWNIDNDNPFNVLNDYLDKSYGIKNIYKKLNYISKENIDSKNDEIIVKYKYKGNNNYYVYSNSFDLSKMIINNNSYVIDTEGINEYKDYHERYIIEESSDKSEFEILVHSVNNEVEPLVYIVDEKILSEFADQVASNVVNISKFNEHSIVGNIDVSDNGVIYTSIPYDKGWKVYVDNKKVETKIIGNALLSFDIDKGNHNIKLEYHIPYIGFGVSITICSIIGLIYLRIKKII